LGFRLVHTSSEQARRNVVGASPQVSIAFCLAEFELSGVDENLLFTG
jgi:hypothetical protein